MLTGKIKVKQQEALIVVTSTDVLGTMLGQNKPHSDRAADNDLLVYAVLRGNVKEAQALILHGASSDVVNKDGTRPGLKLVDYMNYGVKKAKEEGRSYDEKGMNALISTRRSLRINSNLRF
jgi:hypothetical protein